MFLSIFELQIVSINSRICIKNCTPKLPVFENEMIDIILRE